jgi:riboflavin synthase
MFTGIIESMGVVQQITTRAGNKTFWIKSSLFPELKIDQSLSHNGVCLTVEDLREGLHRVTAVKETLDKTCLDEWQRGSYINLERSLTPALRLDGHLVQGHVDSTGRCKKIKDREGSTEITFSFPPEFAPVVIEKGSVCINGISLTAFGVRKRSFKVAIIPFTLQHTNLQFLKEKEKVNLEFDIIGKYIQRMAALK